MLKKTRERKNLRQIDAAEYLGCSLRTYATMEREPHMYLDYIIDGAVRKLKKYNAVF